MSLFIISCFIKLSLWVGSLLIILRSVLAACCACAASRHVSQLEREQSRIIRFMNVPSSINTTLYPCTIETLLLSWKCYVNIMTVLWSVLSTVIILTHVLHISACCSAFVQQISLADMQIQAHPYTDYWVIETCS